MSQSILMNTQTFLMLRCLKDPNSMLADPLLLYMVQQAIEEENWNDEYLLDFIKEWWALR